MNGSIAQPREQDAARERDRIDGGLQDPSSGGDSCEAFAAGQGLFGENRVQEFAGKAPLLQALKVHSST